MVGGSRDPPTKLSYAVFSILPGISIGHPKYWLAETNRGVLPPQLAFFLAPWRRGTPCNLTQCDVPRYLTRYLTLRFTRYLARYLTHRAPSAFAGGARAARHKIARQIAREIARKIERKIARKIERKIERKRARKIAPKIARKIPRKIPRKVPRKIPWQSPGFFRAAAVSYAFFFATELAAVSYAFFFRVSYVFWHFVPKLGRQSFFHCAILRFFLRGRLAVFFMPWRYLNMLFLFLLPDWRRYPTLSSPAYHTFFAILYRN